MNLRLLQLADSALPIGGYTHSWGLEAALARGVVRDIGSLEPWVRSWLHCSLGPLEGVAVGAAWRAAAALDTTELARCDAIVDASLVPLSLRTASREMGAHLLLLGSTWCWAAEGIARIMAAVAEGGWHHPVVFGLLGCLAGAGNEATVAAYLHQALLGMIGAGVRAIPVSHTHGQQLLAYLHDDLAQVAADRAGRSLDEAGSAAPYYEILCDEQTRLYSRMFRS